MDLLKSLNLLTQCELETKLDSKVSKTDKINACQALSSQISSPILRQDKFHLDGFLAKRMDFNGFSLYSEEQLTFKSFYLLQ